MKKPLLVFWPFVLILLVSPFVLAQNDLVGALVRGDVGLAQSFDADDSALELNNNVNSNALRGI